MKYRLQIHGSSDFTEAAQAEACIKQLLGMGLTKMDLVLRAVEPTANIADDIYKPGQCVYINGNKFKGKAFIKSIEEQKIWVVFEPGMHDFRSEELVTHNEEFTANYTKEEAKDMFSIIPI